MNFTATVPARLYNTHNYSESFTQSSDLFTDNSKTPDKICHDRLMIGRLTEINGF